MFQRLASVTSWWNALVSADSVSQEKKRVQPHLESLEERITLSTTALVKDINPNAADSTVQYLANVNGTVFFRANDGTNGSELWKSDGTSAGTQLVKDINPSGSSSPSSLTNVNGTLFFRADDGTNGRELWKSDGTSEGTQLVKNIYPNAAHSTPSHLTNVNGTLLFAADDGNGRELWKSDGTSDGTVLVKDINPFPLGSNLQQFANIDGTLFFSADDGSNGNELWKSDGTSEGTILVRNIRSNKDGSFPTSLTNVNGTLFFAAFGGVNDKELWKSDGTSEGTVLVKDINTNTAAQSNPSFLANVNGTLFFGATDGTTGRELWKSGGTSEGTQLVKDIRPNAGHSLPSFLTNVNGTLFFRANDGTNGYELWTSDGTSEGTTLFEDINPNAPSSDLRYLTNVNGTLFFRANDGVHGSELWTTSTSVSAPDLIPASDTGSSDSDDLTDNTTPTFTGTADPDATVTLFDGNTLLGTATNTNGNWTFTVTTPLTDGAHIITARANESGLVAISPALAVTIDTVPSVTINQSVGQDDPTLRTSIQFTAVFSEAVTGFGADDVILGGTAGATTATVTPVNTAVYAITVTGMAGEGTVTASIIAGAALDATGNTSTASTSTDNSVQFDVIPPLDPPIDPPLLDPPLLDPPLDPAPLDPTPLDPPLDPTLPLLVKRLAVGADAGGSPLVEVYDAEGNRLFGFFAFDASFTGGVRVATGDINGDFVEDIVVAAGPGGGPHVKIFNGVDGSLINEFFAYDPSFAGGVFVAVGDIDNDGFADIVTGAGAGGGPHVRVFSGAGKGTLADFFAYDPLFAGGVTVAVGDIDNDGFGDILTGAGAGGSPHVRIFSGAGKGTLADFFAFDAAFTGGVFVASGDLNGNGFADLIVAAGAGSGPHVRAFDGGGAGILADFFAFDAAFTGGTRVTSLDRDGDFGNELVVAPGPGGGPDVRTFDVDPFERIDSFFTLGGLFGGGLFVG